MDCTIEAGTLDHSNVHIVMREEIGIVDVGAVSLGADFERWVEAFVSWIECCFACTGIDYCHCSITILSNDSCAVGDVGVDDSRSNGLESLFQECRWKYDL